jgi:hypothetical protein
MLDALARADKVANSLVVRSAAVRPLTCRSQAAFVAVTVSSPYNPSS